MLSLDKLKINARQLNNQTRALFFIDSNLSIVCEFVREIHPRWRREGRNERSSPGQVDVRMATTQHDSRSIADLVASSLHLLVGYN